jgi:predicted ATPase
VALASRHGVGGLEAWEPLSRARQLCELLGDDEALAFVVTGQMNNVVHRLGATAALEVAEGYFTIAKQRGSTEHLLLAHRHMGYALWVLGRFTEALEHSERVLALYDPAAHRRLAQVVGFDLKLSALSGASCDLIALGRPEQAAARVAEIVAWTKEVDHPHGRTIALVLAGQVRLMAGDNQGAGPVLAQAIATATEQRFPLWLAIANILQGILVARRDRRPEGLALAHQGLANQRATGSRVWQTCYLGLLAQACEALDRPEEAWEALAEGLDTMETMAERWYEAELHRQKGDCIAAHRPAEKAEAEACLERALQIAREQGAKMWELRAATSLGRFWRDQGKRSEAHDLLAPVYGWFTEGFNTPDLQQAKALLDELRE